MKRVSGLKALILASALVLALSNGILANSSRHPPVPASTPDAATPAGDAAANGATASSNSPCQAEAAQGHMSMMMGMMNMMSMMDGQDASRMESMGMNDAGMTGMMGR